jgi:hypothetical protein
MKQKYQWDGKGEALGSLKNEYNDAVPDTKGQGYFTSLILGGAKYYSLKNEISGEDTSKCKGIKKDTLNHNMFNEESKGVDTIKQRALQFRSGLASYVSESNPFMITKNIVDKHCRFSYTKGKINEDNTISPLTI